MAKRFLDCYASDLKQMGKKELLESIAGSEGRVLACETIGRSTPMLIDVSNAEFACAMGADIILLNIFDVDNPNIQGLPNVPPMETIAELKRLTGRPIGINLEPVGQNETLNRNDKNPWSLTQGRKATLANAKKACDMGVDFILLTGNPGIGVDNAAISETLKLLHKELGDRVILAAGKMHASGIIGEAGEQILTVKDIDEFVDSGADIILLPAPGTVSGITMEYARSLITHAHSLGALTITSIGTSQEGADVATIKQIALMCKMAGTDIHHIGDSGYTGMALPENIFAYSTVIRGVRHTYHRMAASIMR